MKKTLLTDFIDKHTTAIGKARWVSNSTDKTLKSNTASDAKNLLLDLTLKNWDGFGDAELGVGDIPKFKKELTGLVNDDVSCELNYNEDKSRIISVSITSGKSNAIITTSDLDMIPPQSKLKKLPDVSAEVVFDSDLKERFLKAKSALPDVDMFTVMMNKKNVLEIVIGYSNINSSRYNLEVSTQNGKDKVENPLHFRADFLKEILSVNSEYGDVVLSVSDDGLSWISFKNDVFDAVYYLLSSDND
jgi:hypothetical protein